MWRWCWAWKFGRVIWSCLRGNYQFLPQHSSYWRLFSGILEGVWADFGLWDSGWLPVPMQTKIWWVLFFAIKFPMSMLQGSWILSESTRWSTFSQVRGETLRMNFCHLFGSYNFYWLHSSHFINQISLRTVPRAHWVSIPRVFSCLQKNWCHAQLRNSILMHFV